MIQPHSRTKPLRKQERNCPAIEIVSQIHRGRAISFWIEAGGEIGWSRMWECHLDKVYKPFDTLILSLKKEKALPD